VLENITFGLRQQGVSKKEAVEKVLWIVELLHISNLLKRKPDKLSGGESQKVALARALAVRPKVLLLDEPLSALDPDTRETVQQEIRTVHHKLDLTIIHVTHDFEEAVSLGDRIAVLDAGRIVQTGTAEDLFHRPNSELVARFLMTRNIFQGEVSSSEKVNPVIDIKGTKIPVITNLRGNHHACIRPEDVLISTKSIDDNTRAFFKGKVTCIANKGAVVNVTVDIPPEFVSLLTRREFEMIHPTEGEEVFVSFEIRSLHVF
jgi:molybdate/tungstate transport system ATP-binding protein